MRHALYSLSRTKLSEPDVMRFVFDWLDKDGVAFL